MTKRDLTPAQREALERNQFRPGQSGCPGGVSKARSVVHALKEQLGEAAPGQEASVAQALAGELLTQGLQGDRKAIVDTMTFVDGRPRQEITIASAPAQRMWESFRLEQKRYNNMTPEQRVADICEQLDDLRQYLLGEAETEGETVTISTPIGKIDHVLAQLSRLAANHYESRDTVTQGLIEMADRLQGLLGRAQRSAGVGEVNA